MASKRKGGDALTLDLPGIPKRRGRPGTGKAKSQAQRCREYRARLRQKREEGLAARQARLNEFPATSANDAKWDA